MIISLHSAMEQRIQRQLGRGVFAAEEAEETGYLNKSTINRDLDRTFAQAASGEGYSPEQSRALLAQHRASRAA